MADMLKEALEAMVGQMPFMTMVASKPKLNTARITEVFGPWGILALMYFNMQGNIDGMRVEMKAMSDKIARMELSQTKVQSDLDKYISDVNYITGAIKDAGIVKIIK